MPGAVVRSAGENDLARVAALLADRGVVVATASLHARLDDEDGGILLSEHTTISWGLDGGAVHLYDLAGDTGDYEALLPIADAIARARFAAVLTVALYDDDPSLEILRALGFESDWNDADVRAGETVRLVGLVREVS
jgi:hypothetical protein